MGGGGGGELCTVDTIHARAREVPSKKDQAGRYSSSKSLKQHFDIKFGRKREEEKGKRGEGRREWGRSEGDTSRIALQI